MSTILKDQPVEILTIIDDLTGYKVTAKARHHWAVVGLQLTDGYKEWLDARMGEIRPTEYDCKMSIYCWLGQDHEIFTRFPPHLLDGYLVDPIQFGELMCYLNNE